MGWPDTRIYIDVTTLTQKRLAADGIPTIDIITDGGGEMTRNLKLSVEYFDHVKNGTMDFQIRKNDRNYMVGDTLIFSEHESREIKCFTGNQITRIVKYIIQGKFGLPEDICILGLRKEEL